MRILHVIPSLGPVYGGPSKLVPEFARALTKNGVTVHIATTNANGDQCLNVPLGVPILEQEVPTYYFSRHLNERYTFSWPLSRWLWKHIPEYDLVHIHALFSYSTAAASRIAFHFGKQYVVTPHGMLEPWALRYKSWRKRGYFQLMERTNLMGAVALHALTHGEIRNFRALGITRPMFVVPNGLYISEFDHLPPRTTFERRYPETRGKKIVLYLGRIDPKKGLDILVKAFAMLHRQDTHLVIAGPDLTGYRKTIESQVHAEGMMDRVLFTGMLSGREKLSAFSVADLFVLPSRSEGLAMAVLEAMASGLPVIITEGCNFPRAEETKAGKIVPLEVRPLAQAIFDLLEDPQKCMDMGKRGRDLVWKDFNWEKVASRMIEVYEDILKVKRKSMAWVD